MTRRRQIVPHAESGPHKQTPPMTGDQPGTLYVVAVPLGDPDDMSLRALRTLGRVDIIASEDPQATSALLAHHHRTGSWSATETWPPITSYGHDNRDEKTAVLLACLQQSQSVALVVDTGTPGIYDPGAFLVAAAHAQAIPVAPIPGPSALTAALSVSGINGDHVEFVGTPLPSNRTRRLTVLRRLARSPATLVFFGVRASHLRDLAAVFGTRAACLCNNLGSAQEQVIRTQAAALPQSMAHSKAHAEELWTLVLAEARTARPHRTKRKRTITTPQ